MKCAAVSASFLFRLGNWSPDFVLPYAQFVQALKDRDVEKRDVSLERLIENLSKHHQSELESLINRVVKMPTINLDELADKVRSILLHHTKSNLWEKGELDLFKNFVAEWCHARWKTKADKAKLLADEFSAKEEIVKKKMKKALQDDSTHTNN
jgi:hypothetical protein